MMTDQKTGYVAPTRKKIKEEVCKLLSTVDPPVDPKLVRKLDWWALYTIHQDVVKSGKDARELAVRLVKGYDPKKIQEKIDQAAARKVREEERKLRAREIVRKKAEAKAKAAAAKAKARAAKAKARAKK